MKTVSLVGLLGFQIKSQLEVWQDRERQRDLVDGLGQRQSLLRLGTKRTDDRVQAGPHFLEVGREGQVVVRTKRPKLVGELALAGELQHRLEDPLL